MMGIAAALQCSYTLSAAWSLLIPACLIGIIYAGFWYKLGFSFVCGFFWLFSYLALFQHPALPVELEGQDLLVEGVIASIPKVSPRSTRFDFKTRLDNKDYQFRLSWYEKRLPLPRAGELWRLRIKLKRPHGSMNPGGFDYEANLFRHRISATGYVKRDDVNERLTNDKINSGMRVTIARWRQSLSDSLRSRLHDNPYAGLVEAISIGNRDKISPQQWDVLTETGTIHLVAISGLHIGLVAGFAFFLIRVFVSRSTYLINIFPSQVPAAVGAILAALVYALLAGFSIPTQRAFLMVCIVMLSLIRRSTIPASNIIALSLLLILIVDPMSVRDIGFWLSFGAVAIILFATTGRLRVSSALMGLGKIQFVIAIGMLPLMLIFFQRISIVAPVANLFAVPWVSFITVPASLLATVLMDVSPLVSGWLLTIAAGSFELMWLVLEWLNQHSWSIIDTLAPVPWTILPASVAAIYLIMPRGFPARWLAVMLFIPALLVRPQGPAQGELRINLIDVGQGLSVLLQTHQHTLLYDTGAAYSSRFNAGKHIIIPFLKSQGVSEIDSLIVSHGDNDHSGGAYAILQQVPVKQIYSGASPQRWRHEKAIACQAGQSWQWDGVLFLMLHPSTGKLPGGNNNSCVLQVSVGQNTVLIPGDIEKQAEAELVVRYEDKLDSDLLIAPHHGSKTSSSLAFIERVSPEVVLVANGYRNRYRFPHHHVTQRYRDAGSVWFETAKKGGISITMTPQGLTKPVFWREKLRRYWHTW